MMLEFKAGFNAIFPTGCVFDGITGTCAWDFDSWIDHGFGSGLGPSQPLKDKLKSIARRVNDSVFLCICLRFDSSRYALFLLSGAALISPMPRPARATSQSRSTQAS